MTLQEIRNVIRAYYNARTVTDALARLADDTGIPVGTLSCALYGHGIINVERAARIATVVGVELRELTPILSRDATFLLDGGYV